MITLPADAPAPDVPYLLPPEGVATLAEHLAAGGGVGLDTARRLGPDATIEEVEAAGLRGRGGAGFPTGTKWRSVASGGPGVGDRFVVVNGAEGEPGTFKDRTLLRANPYAVLEGAAIAAHAIGARDVYVAVKSSFVTEAARLEVALRETAEAGWFEGRGVHLVRGPEEYLFGEEKALLEVVEGEDPLPRLFPPYVYGLFSTAPQLGWSAGTDASSTGPTVPSSNPTLVNNVETLANVGPILAHGPAWYRGSGTDRSPGHLLVTVSGDTRRAGVAEVPMGTPLVEVIDAVGGGLPEGRTVKGVLSGVANPVLTAEHLGVALTYEALAEVGAGLGSAGFMVFDDTRNMVEVAYWVSAFLYVESCGQCPACKFGTGEVTAYLHRILSGRGTDHDLEVIAQRMRTVDDAARCGLPVQERSVVSSLLATYPDDVLAAATGELAGSAAPAEPMVAKIVDIGDDGTIVLDDRQRHKRPDWTYAEEPVVIGRR